MRRLLLGSLLVLWAASARAGEIVDVPFAMEVGDRAEWVTEETKENPAHAAKGWPAERSRSVGRFEVVEALDEGYLVRSTFQGYETEGGDPAKVGIRRAMVAPTLGLVVEMEVSETGAPHHLRDWRGLLERILANLDGAIAQAGLEPAAAARVAQVTRSMFTGLDDARATQLLGEGMATWAWIHDLRIEEGRTVEGTSTEASPLTGDPIDMAYKLRLLGIDRVGGVARVEVRQTASPASMTRLVEGLVDRAARGMGKPLPEEGRAEFRRLFEDPGNEFAFNQTFEIGLDDGWTRTVVDERTMRLGTAVQGRQVKRITVRRLP